MNRRVLAVLAILFVPLALILAGTLVLRASGDDGPERLVEADFPSALVPLEDGGLLYAERGGAILSVGADGDDPERVAEVETEPGEEDQRGLIGLARDGDGRVFATWTLPDEGIIVIGQVAPGPERIIWEGPPSARQANGGTLTFDSPEGDAALIVGIGDLEEPERTPDPTTPNGKLLSLDPDGEPDQVPEVISSGWNNPFAYTYDGDELWVADNAPPSKRERLARGDADGEPTVVTELDVNLAPAGVVALGDRRYGICAYLTEELRVYAVDDEGRATEDEDLRTDGCRLAVDTLADGRLVFASEEEITVTGPPG